MPTIPVGPKAGPPIALLVASLLTACASRIPPAEARSGPFPTCSVELAGTERISEEPDLALYVEPRVVGPIEGGYLVAGQPTYTWTLDSSDRASLASSGDFFGAIVRNGRAERIPMPPDVGPVGWVFGAALGAQRWAFIFEELDRPSVIEGEMRRALYGELGPDGWERVHEIEEPPGGRINLPGSSAIRPAEGGVDWATLHVGDRGGIDVIRYRRRDGSWTVSTLVEDWADAVDLISGADGSPWLALSGLDPDFGSRLASLRLVEGVATARESVHRIVTGAPGDRFRTPRMARSASGIQAGWRRLDDSGASAWAAVVRDRVGGRASGQAPTPVLLDDEAALLLPVVVASGPILWATLSIDRVNARQRIRLYRVSGDTATRIFDLESPFRGPFGIFSSPSGELLVIGPEAHADAPTPFVRSLVLRLNLVCDQVAAADHPPGS